MAIIIRCDKCEADIKEGRISKLGLDGYSISLNRLRNEASGERADLCESCLRLLLTKGTPVD